jgi:catechol 2,3-dioxygenase-like lactoylglutathione lyase family enzyme
MPETFPTPDMALTHILVVSNVPASKRWYQEVLGADPYRDYGSSAVLSFNGAWLLLVTGGDPTPDKPGIEFAPPEPGTATHSFTIRVRDCQASYDALTRRGAQFITPPYDWGGEIRCFLPDPDGHLWEISQTVDNPGGDG